MTLDITKLENVNCQQEKILARCPACSEIGQDKKGEHLFIDEEGRFGCIVYPDEAGKEHRKRIFTLVGIKTTERYITVKNNDNKQTGVIILDVLGRLGRQKNSLSKKTEIPDVFSNKLETDYKNSVPSVPDKDIEWLFEDFIERASIKEYEAGLARHIAEKQAFIDVVSANDLGKKRRFF